MRTMIITPYLHKARKQLNKITAQYIDKGSLIVRTISDEFDKNYKVIFDNDTVLWFVLALPNEINDKIYDMYYDVVYIDKEYNDDEVQCILANLIGTESKPIIYF